MKNLVAGGSCFGGGRGRCWNNDDESAAGLARPTAAATAAGAAAEGAPAAVPAVGAAAASAAAASIVADADST